MHFSEHFVFQWISQYAYQPEIVYIGVFALMFASGFGLPIPEEVTIISVGILAFMGANPQLFPPPYSGAPVVNGYEVAVFTLMAVFLSDQLVFWIGRLFGRKFIALRGIRSFFTPKVMERTESFVKRYGSFAAFVFRFTPGIRFPAHVILGMSQFSAWRFATIDGVAALISVPTQILLVYHYGESILSAMYQFKIVLAVLAGLALTYWLGKKAVSFIKARKTIAKS